jgi:hypothetical protein
MPKANRNLGHNNAGRIRWAIHFEDSGKKLSGIDCIVG